MSEYRLLVFQYWPPKCLFPSFSSAPLSGLSSVLNNQTGTTSTTQGSSDKNQSPDPKTTHYSYPSPKTTDVPSVPTSVSTSIPPSDVSIHPTPPNAVQPSDLPKEVEQEKVDPVTLVSSTLDSKIDSFLQENPKLSGFNMGFPTVLTWSGNVDSPSASTDNLGGTPVRDESGATPTQDEVMDDPPVNTFSYQASTLAGSSVTGPPLASYSGSSWQEQNSHVSQYGPRSQSGRDGFQRDFAEMGPISLASNNQMANPMEHGQADKDWHGKAYGQEQRLTSTAKSYRDHQHRSQDTNPNFLNTPLPPIPPIPQLPPPPQDLLASDLGGITGPSDVQNPADSFQIGRRNSQYYNEPNEPFHPHLNVSAPNHGGVPPRHFLPGPQNGPAGYNHHSRVPVLPQRHPGMSFNRPSFPDREYYDSPIGRGAHAAFVGRGLYAPPGVRGVHVPPGGRGVNVPSVEGGIHESLESRLALESLGGKSFHNPSIGSGIHENLSGSGVHEPSDESGLDEHPSEDKINESPSRKRVHELSQSEDLCEDSYLPAGNPSPSAYDSEPPNSPQSHTFYGEKRPLLQHRPQHRPPPPQHFRSLGPSHYPPQRPLRRPPPQYALHPSEHPFQRIRRPGPPFVGAPRPAGPFYPPKRPFFQPRY